MNAMSYLTTMLGRYFEKQIPHDMFYDVEDGSTPSLTLTVTLPYDQPLPPNFWVQFDPSRQVSASEARSTFFFPSALCGVCL